MQQQNKAFPPQVTQALERGDLMAAIKLLRASGFGLKEAKDALESHVRATRPATTDMKQRVDSPHPVDATKIVSELSPGQVKDVGEGIWLVIAIVIGVLVAFLVTGCAMSPRAPAVPAATVAQIAPGGKLRAAINFGNPILATKDQATGEPRGVSVDLSRELGKRLGVPVELVTFEGAGRVVDAVKNAQVDIGFVAIDPVRGADILQTPPYVIIEGAYLVRFDSPIRRNEEVDTPGIRVAVGNGSAYDLYLTRELKNAKLVKAQTSPAVVDHFLAQKLEVAAGVKQQLEADAKRIPGLRLLDGRFMVIQQAMGLPKGRDAGAAYVSRFVQEMKASGFVAAALSRHRIEGALVAP